MDATNAVTEGKTASVCFSHLRIPSLCAPSRNLSMFSLSSANHGLNLWGGHLRAK